MKLKIGKTYIDRDGSQHTITRISSAWAIADATKMSWCKDTGAYIPCQKSPVDLIAEVAPKSGVFAGYAALKNALSHEASQNTHTEMLQCGLSCLNVQPGDVVQVHADAQGGLIENGEMWTITSVEGGKYRGRTGKHEYGLRDDTIFKLISRASPAPKSGVSPIVAAINYAESDDVTLQNALLSAIYAATIEMPQGELSCLNVQTEQRIIKATAGEHIAHTLERAFDLAVKEKRTVTAIHNDRHIEISVKEVK